MNRFGVVLVMLGAGSAFLVGLETCGPRGGVEVDEGRQRHGSGVEFGPDSPGGGGGRTARELGPVDPDLLLETSGGTGEDSEPLVRGQESDIELCARESVVVSAIVEHLGGDPEEVAEELLWYFPKESLLVPRVELGPWEAAEDSVAINLSTGLLGSDDDLELKYMQEVLGTASIERFLGGSGVGTDDPRFFELQAHVEDVLRRPSFERYLRSRELLLSAYRDKVARGQLDRWPYAVLESRRSQTNLEGRERVHSYCGGTVGSWMVAIDIYEGEFPGLEFELEAWNEELAALQAELKLALQ